MSVWKLVSLWLWSMFDDLNRTLWWRWWNPFVSTLQSLPCLSQIWDSKTKVTLPDLICRQLLNRLLSQFSGVLWRNWPQCSFLCFSRLSHPVCTHPHPHPFFPCIYIYLFTAYFLPFPTSFHFFHSWPQLSSVFFWIRCLCQTVVLPSRCFLSFKNFLFLPPSMTTFFSSTILFLDLWLVWTLVSATTTSVHDGLNDVVTILGTGRVLGFIHWLLFFQFRLHFQRRVCKQWCKLSTLFITLFSYFL